MPQNPVGGRRFAQGGHGLALSDEDSVPKEGVHFWCDACGRSCTGRHWYCEEHSIDFCLDCVAEYVKVGAFLCASHFILDAFKSVSVLLRTPELVETALVVALMGGCTVFRDTRMMAIWQSLWQRKAKKHIKYKNQIK